MKITLNGKEKEFQNIENLTGIIQQFGKHQSHVIAEVNGEIIKSLNWNNTPIKDGDTIELVNFVGGG